ncbi:Esophageal cancer related protein 4 precursor-like [Arapaima gigas]
MAPGNLSMRLLLLALLLTCLACSVMGQAESKLATVALLPSKAKEFLTSLRRPKRNIWDRSRPDVQQWIMQFMYMGFDEAQYHVSRSTVDLHIERTAELE